MTAKGPTSNACGPLRMQVRRIFRVKLVALTSRLADSQDHPSPGWLGHHAIPAQIRQSGLWNVEHVTQSCRPGFLATLYQLVQLHK